MNDNIDIARSKNNFKYSYKFFVYRNDYKSPIIPSDSILEGAKLSIGRHAPQSFGPVLLSVYTCVPCTLSECIYQLAPTLTMMTNLFAKVAAPSFADYYAGAHQN